MVTHDEIPDSSLTTDWSETENELKNDQTFKGNSKKIYAMDPSLCKIDLQLNENYDQTVEVHRKKNTEATET